LKSKIIAEQRPVLLKKLKKIPKHIAFIMDGNGRWAKKRLMPRQSGHREGIKTMEIVSKEAHSLGVKYLSFFAFSTENWARPKSEVDYLLGLLKKRLPELAAKLREHDTTVMISGDLSGFDAELQKIIKDTVALSNSKVSGGNGFVSNICLNYGGRAEIVSAANKAVASGQRVSEESFAKLLYTAQLPDPDLLIRTGGERRISNFMLYQSAYTELYFSDKMWPDFGVEELHAALQDYSSRARRFGKV